MREAADAATPAASTTGSSRSRLMAGRRSCSIGSSIRLRKRSRKLQREAAEKQKLQDAYDLGQKATKQFMSEADAFTAPRFAILRQNFPRFSASGSMPPRQIPTSRRSSQRATSTARLWTTVNKYKPAWAEEVLSAHSAWIDAFEKIDGTAVIWGYLQQKVDDFSLEMFEVGLQELLSRVDYLKPLDDAWRASNREKSAQYPPLS